MATTTTSKSILVDENTRKLRGVVSKRLKMKEDPEKLRWILTQYGYTDDAVNSEIERQMTFQQTGQPAQAKPEAFNASDLGTGDLRKQYEALSMAKDEVSKYRSIIDKYTSDNAPVQLTGKEAAELRTAQSSLLFLIAQASGTGALQAPDREVVERIIPDPTSISGATGILTRGGKQGMLTSLDKAQDILNSRLSLLSGGQAAATPSANNNVATPTAQANPIDQQAVKWLEANPNDPRAEKVRAKLQSKGFLGSSTAPASSAVSGSTEPNSAFGGDLAGAVGRTTGKIFGGDKIGEAIGNVLGGQLAKNGEAGQLMQDNLAKLTQLKADGKIDEEKYNMLIDNLEKTAKEAFGYTGPSFKEVAGDAIKVGATFLGGGAVRGATLLGTAARTAAVGAVYSGADAAAQNKDKKDIVIDSLIGGAIGGAIPLAGAALGKGYKAIVGKNTPEEALGEILQGKTKDLKAGQRALAAIDTTGVKTYEDLASKLDESISYLSRKVDELLGQDKTLTKLSDLATTAKSKGGATVKTNYVQQAIEHLDELYTKSGDSVAAQNMKELLAKAQTQGLTKVEINQLARDYGRANKSFTKFGEQLTSVNSKMYENTRSGLKEVARRGLNGEAAKNLDGLISDTMHTRELIEKNMEAVNKLEQRAEKMGLGRTIVTKAIRAIDIATLGGTRAIRESLIQSNVGKKTMNAFDVETKLQDNLKIIEKALKASTPGKLEKALQELNKKLLNSVKGKGGLSIQDVSKGKAGYSDDLLQGARKYTSAEEFVKSKTPVFRSSKESFSAEKVNADYGIPVAKTKETAEIFNRGGRNIEDLYIEPGAKVLRELPPEFKVGDNFDTDIVAYAKKNGFDVIDLKPERNAGIEELRVVNPEMVKTKSQLTDIWKKAQGETKRGFGTGAGRMKNEMEKISLNVGEVYTKGKKIKESILNELADFTEYAAKQKQGIKIERIPEEIRARAIAEKLGINPDVSNWMLSKKFGKLLKDNNWNR